MKRLFGVKVNGKMEYFHRKEDAKEVRDEITKETGKQSYVVLGPDHIGYHGHPSKYRHNKVRL